MSTYSYERPFVEIDSFGERDESLYKGIKLSADKNVSYMRSALAKGITVQEHFHDWIEFVYIASGKLRYTLGEKSFELRKGGFLMNDYNAMHGYSVTEDADVIFFQLKHGYIEQLAPNFVSANIVCNFTESEASAEKKKNLLSLFSSAVDCFLGEGSLNELGFKSYVMLLTYFLIKDFSAEQIFPPEGGICYNAEYTGLLLDYMHKHYQESITLNILSEKFHLSSAYISRLFKDGTGIGFKEYLNQIRLNNAVYLLLNTDKSLLDISVECGFPNNKSFIESFKQAYSQTPNQYRRQNRNS